MAQIVKAVMSNPKVWRKTALFITWDENGGFFDHVAPPAAPRGTKGEYLTVANLPAAANGIRGPIGLGFRVPMLIVSPFTRGGLVSSDTFDHTSMLRFVETRFGVEVPNLSAWRRRVTGDLTSAFNFAAKPNDGKPKLAARDRQRAELQHLHRQAGAGAVGRVPQAGEAAAQAPERDRPAEEKEEVRAGAAGLAARRDRLPPPPASRPHLRRPRPAVARSHAPGRPASAAPPPT